MNAEEILKTHNIKNTGCRKHILNELLSSGSALSENQIKDSLPDLFDRVTFYRSLKLLENQRIIHRIVLPDATIKYALNNDVRVGISGSHAHFHCTCCGIVFCMKDAVDTKFHLPHDFTMKSVQILIEGSCPDCIVKNKQA